MPSRTAQETLPWRSYSEPELLRREQERIILRAWQYAGLAERVASPGDYFTCRVGDVPVVVVRDRLMPESERLIAHFQGLVREALA